MDEVYLVQIPGVWEGVNHRMKKASRPPGFLCGIALEGHQSSRRALMNFVGGLSLPGNARDEVCNDGLA